MNDLSTLTMQPKTLTVDGREYKVHPLTLGDFGALQAWVDSQIPDPCLAAKKAINSGGLNMAQQQCFIREALQLASRRHLIGTPEADALIRSVEGMKYTLYLSIRKGDPAFTEKDAEAMFAKMDFMDMASFGQASTLDMVVGDPKEGGTNEPTPS